MRSKKQQVEVEEVAETVPMVVDENVAGNSERNIGDKPCKKRDSSSSSGSSGSSKSNNISENPSKKRSSKDGSGPDRQNDGERLIIKKKKKTSHGKKRVSGEAAAPSSLTASTEGSKAMTREVKEIIVAASSSFDKNTDSDKWRAKYEALRKTKNEEMEGMLAKMEQHTQQRQDVEQSLAKHLKGDVERLTNELSDLKSKSAEVVPDAAAEERAKLLEHQNKDLLAEIEELKSVNAKQVEKEESEEPSVDPEEFAAQKKMLAMYRRLTGLQFSFVQEEEDEEQETERDPNSSRLLCTAANRSKQKAAKFELIVPASAEEEVEYLPVANTEILPAFAQEEICFEGKMAPVFVSKIVNALFRGQ
jgi:hypothetical protein